MLTLLNVPISPFGTKVKIAMIEKGLAFETREPDLEQAQAGGDRRLTASSSPRLEIPVLIDGDAHIWDSTVIMEYLEEKFPETPLMPEDPAERAQIRMLEDICDTTFEAAVWGLYEVSIMGRVSGDRQMKMQAEARAEIAGLHRWLERRLSSEGWLVSDRFCWADCAALPPIFFASKLGTQPEPGSRLGDWLARMQQRPSVGRISAEFDAWYETPKNRPTGTGGTWKRLYKSHRLEWMCRAGGVDLVAEGLAADNVRFSPLIE